MPIQTEMASKSKVRQTLTFLRSHFLASATPLGHLYCDDIQGVQRPHVAIPISTDAPASAPLALLANAPSLYVRSAGAAVIFKEGSPAMSRIVGLVLAIGMAIAPLEGCKTAYIGSGTNYFPLTPNSTWTYQIVAKSQGTQYQITDRVIGVKYVPALKITGSVVDETYSLERINQSHHTFVETKEIETPAGRFNNCIRIETQAKYEGGMYARKKQQLQLTYLDWYAPNVGLIKTVALEGGPTGPEMDRVELLRFNVAPSSAQ